MEFVLILFVSVCVFVRYVLWCMIRPRRKCVRVSEKVLEKYSTTPDERGDECAHMSEMICFAGVRKMAKKRTLMHGLNRSLALLLAPCTPKKKVK